MKIFLAATSLDTAYGGPAYSVSRLAVALASSGDEVGLWAADGSAATTHLLRSDAGVRRLRGSERQALREFGTPDVLHDNGLWMPHNHRLCRIATKGGIPRVVSPRGMLEPWAMNHKRMKKQVAWWIYQKNDLRQAAVLHATADAEAANLQRLALGVPINVVANGVDIAASSFQGTDDASANPRGVRTALFVGRLYPVKGLPMLIDAWAQVRPEGWRLRIVGPDEAGHRADIEGAVNALGLGSVVTFAGPLEGAAKAAAFNSADLFVSPTHSESFGMTIAEALGSGLPVLTTTGAPWPMLIERGCGWRVEPTVQGLSAGLRTAVSLDPKTLCAMGAVGRDMVASLFRWELIADQFHRLYEDAVANQA